jgi:glycosyltransferase involved in cell wall biosynthesis
MKRVVFFRSNPIAPDPRVEKAANALSKTYPVHVVGWDRTGVLPAKQGKPGFTLELFSYAAPFGSGIKNLLHLFRWQLFLVHWVFRFGRFYPIIHACDFDTVLPALLGKLFFGCKVIYDIFDFYADHIRNTPQWLKRMIRWLDHKAIGTADAVILATEAQLRQLEGVKPARVVVIYNTPPDLQAADDLQRDPSVELRIAYIGILQLERGLLEMIDVVGKHAAWHLDLAGFGGDEAVIVRQALERRNITWHGRVAYEKTLALSRAADVLFSTCDPAVPNYRHAGANKIFEAMMLSRPIIVARGTNMDLMVEKYQCGLVVPYGDTGELEAALERLANDADLRLRMGQNGRQAYETTYSWGEMEKRLFDLYGDLAQG